MAASLYRLFNFEELERLRIREGGVSFKLKGIARIITIRAHWDILTTRPQHRTYKIQANFALKTPAMSHAYIPEKITANDENQAILEYVARMLEYYREATIQRHHRPGVSWLRPLPGGWL
ncbi:hypothetical protein Ga0123462_2205 [Mariprofundus ferrinatatus]|uniref:Uncharacterized protein n=1 Tax=Mariprofundus ferrinatatus TaxID=1921087 RepID=A0A2K8L9V9_9PROT|nr:hypothetical protein [Mariprofundus ferrinatatus]ATX83039.1 hypothetical protein Ga0123462_2205 [Mariprofundus ferrinatatus]